MEKIFNYLDGQAPKCGKCGKRMHCKAVRMGFYKDIIAIYSCGCGKEYFKYRGLGAEERKIVEGLLGKEKLLDFETKQNAAARAVIKCESCGAAMRYVESAFNRKGKFMHRYDCRNRRCKDYEKSEWIEISDEECKKIRERSYAADCCGICGNIIGHKVKCKREGRLICEEHCRECEFRDERFGCRF